MTFDGQDVIGNIVIIRLTRLCGKVAHINSLRPRSLQCTGDVRDKQIRYDARIQTPWPDDNQVGANNGGLGGVLNSLRNAGMGQAADSWVGNGTNQSVSPAELERALGHDTVRQFGERAGIGGPESAGVLADLLPELINQMTPKGQEPQGPDLGGLLKQLLR